VRKKCFKSAARVRERVSFKVQGSDFEMIRVLGKGCAGNVLLVYALGAGRITPRDRRGFRSVHSQTLVEFPRERET
jgi:hypothetical protein